MAGSGGSARPLQAQVELLLAGRRSQRGLLGALMAQQEQQLRLIDKQHELLRTVEQAAFQEWLEEAVTLSFSLDQ